jgi:hypothetical protein
MRKGGVGASFDVPEREENERGFERREGSFTVSESTASGGGTRELRRGISAARQRLLQRRKGGAREESRGFYRVEP